MKIGFIGLGIMGKPMAKTQGGVYGFAGEQPQSGSGAGTGSRWCEGRGQAGNRRAVRCGHHHAAQLPGSEGSHAGRGRRGCAHEAGGSDPVASKEIYAELQKKGIEMLDAPVSGGEPKAIDGTLSFMVGGKQEIFDAYKPILDAMGASAVRCGEIGAGNTTKLANQIIVACNIQALAEALTLAQKAGVDPELVFQAIKGGLAGSTVMNAKAPMMMEGNDKPGFKIDLHIKDLNNVLDCAHAVGAPVPMTAEVQEIFQWLHNHDKGQADHSAIAQYYEYLTGIKIGR